MMNNLNVLPIETLKRAVGIREQIDQLTGELNRLLNQPRMTGAPAAGGKNRKRELSPAGRARIAAAQRLRWAKFNSGRVKPAKPHAGRNRLSATGRNRIAAAVTARWERYRAAKILGLKTK
jgi:hypothetical protein